MWMEEVCPHFLSPLFLRKRRKCELRLQTPLLEYAVAEPQAEYGAELFEKYQREHGKETVQAAEKTVMQEVGKSR